MTKIFNQIKDIAFAFDKEAFVERSLHLSFIIYKGRIISIGQNSKKTHPINLRNPRINKEGVNISNIKGSCSEWGAISRLRNLTNIPSAKCSLINIRINKLNEIRMSQPCSSCRNLIRYQGFKNVWFSNETGTFEKYDVETV